MSKTFATFFSIEILCAIRFLDQTANRVKYAKRFNAETRRDAVKTVLRHRVAITCQAGPG